MMSAAGRRLDVTPGPTLSIRVDSKVVSCAVQRGDMCHKMRWKTDIFIDVFERDFGQCSLEVFAAMQPSCK